MARKPIGPLNTNAGLTNNSEIDCAYEISEEQLKNSKIFSSRESYVKTLKNGIKYMEIGVAWGYYSDLVINACNPSHVDLLDSYDQDLKCWSWRKFGSCQCEGMTHTLQYTQETHEQFIKEKYKNNPNVYTIKGDSRMVLPLLNGKKEYDYIYIDITNWRDAVRPTLKFAADLVPVGGIIGLNDYVIYDGVIEDMPYATFQVVNEFLMKNKNWEVDAIALHVLGFYDIYIKKVN